MLDAHPAPSTATPLPAALPATEPALAEPAATPGALLAAARTLLPVLEAGQPLDAPTLRRAMTRAFGATDAQGGWLWKDAYEASEAALVLFLQRYGRAMRREAGAGADGPAAMLHMLDTLAALEPSQTRRSEQQLRLQQFSTPLPLAYAALQAAAIRPGDVVLEPSAGTGMLAVMAQLALGKGAAGALHLNEIAAVRAGLLATLFPGTTVTRHNGESIRDRLPELRPTVVLMNPPFSASPGVERIRHHADLHHIRSAFSMLPPGGRLVAISSAHCVPGDSAWEDAFASLDPPAHAVFTAPIDGRAYTRRGTSFDTRLTVLDRGGEKPARVHAGHPVRDAGHLLQVLTGNLPARRRIEPVPGADLFDRTPAPRPAPAKRKTSASPLSRPDEHDWGPVAELSYRASASAAPQPDSAQSAGSYTTWRPTTIQVPGATEHPTPLVQSGAMAAVPHPAPTYRPMLPERIISGGLLSDAQLESVVLAAQAHSHHLAAEYRIGAQWETVQRVDSDGNAENDDIVGDDEILSDPLRFRRGWMLGDGTGCGKGRQVAAIILGQWLRGREHAGPPPGRRRRRTPDRPHPRTGRAHRLPRSPRPRRCRQPHRGRGSRRGHAARRVLPARQRLEARATPPHGGHAHRDRGARRPRHRSAQAHGLHDGNRVLAHPPVRTGPHDPRAHPRPLAPRRAAERLNTPLARRPARIGPVPGGTSLTARPASPAYNDAAPTTASTRTCP